MLKVFGCFFLTKVLKLLEDPIQPKLHLDSRHIGTLIYVCGNQQVFVLTFLFLPSLAFQNRDGASPELGGAIASFEISIASLKTLQCFIWYYKL